MILDSSAVIAMLLGEPEAEPCARACHAAPSRAMSAATWLEAAIVADNRSSDVAAAFDRLMDKLKPDVVAVTAAHALLAREAHRRYGRGRHPAALNIGDCFAYALATERGEPLLFKGRDFAQTDVKAAI